MYFQMFYPFFQGLPVMPFTFLAVLTAEQLDSLLESEDNEELLKLPTSGVIACVRYHVGEYHKVKTTYVYTTQLPYLFPILLG